MDKPFDTKPIHENAHANWLARCAARLCELVPKLTYTEACDLAENIWLATSHDHGPERAAEMAVGRNEHRAAKP
jgi:hypothetical protein